MRLSLGQVALATGGTLLCGDIRTPVTAIGTDTRALEPGSWFLALQGNNFDGHAFIDAAVEKGAAGVICSTVPDNLPDTLPTLVVSDTTDALGRIACAWRCEVSPAVIAITGSAGKTTCKEMAAHILSARVPVLATQGNLNNHIGLPLTLLRLEERHPVAVVELGMNHHGEIRYLTGIARPDIGVLTNIGDAHLGNFENRDALARAKGELFEAMRPTGHAIVNADCPYSRLVRERGTLPQNVLLFGESEEADVRALDVCPALPVGFSFELAYDGRSVPIRLPVFGRYQIANALAAASVALLLGVTLEEIAARLETFQAPQLRSRVTEAGGVRIVEDCYNASPSATVAAIESFSSFSKGGRRFLLLGDMQELGAFSEEGHRRVGEAAARCGADEILCVGQSALWIADEAQQRGTPAGYFPALEPAVERLAELLAPGDSLLVKGSRLARLERAVERIARHLEPNGNGEAVS